MINPRQRLFLLASILLLPPCFLPAADLNIYAAASLKNVLTEVVATYEKTHPGRASFNFAGSDTLARQITEGAPADIFISADEAKMNSLEKAGLLASDTRRNLLSNTLVVIVHKSTPLTITTIQDLTAPGIKRIALAQPASVPAGIYAREYLVQAKVWTAVESRVVPTENVRAALAAVESGNAEAAIVYKTDALISSSVRIALDIPVAEGPRILYPGAIIKKSGQSEAARTMLEYFASEPAQTIFRKYGFLPPR